MLPFSFTNLLVAFIYLSVIGALVLIGQMLFHWRLITGEYSRKLIHITVALWMATWRFNLSHLEITYLCLALLAGLFFIKQFKWFNAIFTIERATYGEFIYVIAIMFTALVVPSPAVYALAIVNLGLVDGFAAIIGTRFGRKKYDVFGSTKSIAGLLTSFTMAILTGIAFWYLAIDNRPDPIFMITHLVAVSAVIAGLEFVSFRGLDNLTIPLATGLLYTGVLTM